jgi:hypothetical protein
MKRFAFILTFVFLCVSFVSATATMDPEYERGLQYYNSGQFEKSAEHFKHYVKKNPKPSAYYLIGYSLYKLGRHDEAHPYFEEAYFIDPEFSPLQFFDEDIQKKFQKDKIEMPLPPIVPPEKTESDKPIQILRGGTLQLPPTASKITKPSVKEAVPEKQPEEEAAPEQLTVPSLTMKTPEERVVPEEAQPEITLPEGFPEGMEIPPMPEGFPEGMEMPKGFGAFSKLAGVAGIFSGIVGLFMQIALYVFTALCLFRIGNKLDVRNSWFAWIPILNYFWPTVGAGGQTVRQGLLFLLGLPLLAALLGGIFAMINPMISMVVMLVIGLVVFGYFIWLWMNISENLGKERLLGLLMIVPIANLIFMGYLAFSE